MRRAWKILAGAVIVVALLVVAGIVALNTIDANRFRPVIADAVMEATGRRLTMEGDLVLHVGFPVHIAFSNIGFANADWGSRPEMITARHVAVQVRPLPLLLGELRILRVVVEGADVLLETNREGRGNWQFDVMRTEAVAPAPAQPDGKGQGTFPSVGEVDVREVTVVYRDGQTGKAQQLVLGQLTLDAEGPDSPLQLSLEAKVNAGSVTAKGTVGRLHTLIAADMPYPVALEFAALGVRGSIDGSIARPTEGRGIDLAVVAAGQDLAKEAAAIGLDLPSLPPFRLVGRFSDKDGMYTLDGMTASVGGSDFSGRVQVTMAEVRPRIAADLTSKVVRLDELAAGKAVAAGAPGGSGAAAGKSAAGRVIPDDPVPFDVLSSVDATVSIAVEKLVVDAGVRAEQLSLEAKLDHGRLSAQPRIGRIAGGSLGGTVEASADGAIRAKIDAEGVGAGQLLKALSAIDILDGAPVDASITAAGRGASLSAIAAGLDADVRLVVGQGRVSNQALGLAAGDAMSQLVGALNPFAKQDPTTVLKCAVIRAPIRKGQATFDRSIGIETDKLDAVGSGTIHLGSEAIDLAMRTTPREGLGISVADAAASFIRLQGTLASPRVAIDPLGSAEGVAKLGLTVGAAIATGGLSLLGPSLLESDGPACQVALGRAAKAGKPGEPAKTKPKEDSGPLEGIGKGIKGLFGN